MPIIRSSRLYVCCHRLWCAMPWLLVVGGQEESSRLCVRDEGCCGSNIPHPKIKPGSLVHSKWTDPGLNPGLRSDSLANNRLSSGTALKQLYNLDVTFCQRIYKHAKQNSKYTIRATPSSFHMTRPMLFWREKERCCQPTAGNIVGAFYHKL